MSQNPLDLLGEVAKKRSLSQAEEEALRLALQGIPAEDISRQLNITPVAVRKRLGEVYRKFGIKGKGHGKLIELKRMLSANYQYSALTPLVIQPVQPSWDDRIDVKGVFRGRSETLDELKQWIDQDQIRLLVLYGQGGIGKTSLAAKLADELNDQFERVIWRSLQTAPKLESLLEDILSVFHAKESSATVDQKISKLIQYLGQHRCLLVLDNAESILQKGTLAGEYQKDYENYGELLKRLGEVWHQSCVIVTSREKPKEAAVLQGKNLPTRAVKIQGLESADGRRILHDKGLQHASEEDLDKLIQIYSGNPLALKIVATVIYDLFDNKVSQFVAQEVSVISDIEDLLDQQFDRLSPLEKQIMYWLALNCEPLTIQRLYEDLVSRNPRSELLDAQRSLLWRSLIEKRGGKLTQQPVISEYMIKRFVEKSFQELQSEEFSLLKNYTLIKASSKDIIRQTQERLILRPVADRLEHLHPAKHELEDKLRRILSELQKAPYQSFYLAGNLLNLMRSLHIELKGQDFSNLTIWQAYLEEVDLSDTNFTNADLSNCGFKESLKGLMSVAVHPSGEYFATGMENGEIRLWRTVDSKQIYSYQGQHDNWVWSIVFSQKGDFFVSGSEDGKIVRWNTFADPECSVVIKSHGEPITSIALSPDDQSIASASEDHTVKIWKTETGELLQTLNHEDTVRSVTFSPDGTCVAAANGDQITVWHLLEPKPIHRFTEHDRLVYSVSISPNGSLLASGGEDSTVRLWNLITGEYQGVLHDREQRGHKQKVHAVRFSPDGTMIASASADRTVRVWNVENRTCLAVLEGHSSQVWSVSFPDNFTLISTSDDQTARLWSLRNNTLLNTIRGYTRGVHTIAFQPDGRVLASGNDDGRIRLWNWTAVEGQCLKALHDDQRRIRAVAFSPKRDDAKPAIVRLASGSADAIVRVWDVTEPQNSRCLWKGEKHSNWIWCTAFSPDGKTLATGSEDYTVWLWDVDKGVPLSDKPLSRHTRWVLCVAFSPDGCWLASGGGDDLIRLWDVRNIKQPKLLQSLQGHTNWVWAISFAPVLNPADPVILASGSVDSTIKLWNVETGEHLFDLPGHTGAVYTVAFHPYRKLLASGGADGIIRVWNIETRECVHRHDRQHSASIRAIAFSPDGHTIASGSEDETIGLWEFERNQSRKLESDPLYKGMNIAGVTGLNPAQKRSLISLGATD